MSSATPNTPVEHGFDRDEEHSHGHDVDHEGTNSEEHDHDTQRDLH